ncbi:hypothetical protein TIFTF001_029423 [Ficus carica]|uniref:Uncharacterized protein n=1 Tax=Ficus carica TaxID=3494 RepID=A0AA88DVY7_FICCA|nr:hypothetical protein TIFTF001_029423 [Ficus carica]
MSFSLHTLFLSILASLSTGSTSSPSLSAQTRWQTEDLCNVTATITAPVDLVTMIEDLSDATAAHGIRDRN